MHPHQEKSSSQQRHNLVGGLDVSLRFAHHSDWEKVIKAAHGAGWEMAPSEVLGEDEAWTESRRSLTLTISMPRVWLPVHCLLLPGHSELQRSTFCYFRYKFYDDDAFCSQMRHPSFGEVEEEGLVTVTFQESRTIELGCTQPLMWYLREEKLEVQVWSAFTKDKTQRPRDTDRLVGSAFIDLSSFAKTSRQKVTISGKMLEILLHLQLISSISEPNSRFLVLQECFRYLDAQQQIYRGLLSESTLHWSRVL